MDSSNEHSFSSPLQFELQTSGVYRWKLELEEAVGFPPSTSVNSTNEFHCFPRWLRPALLNFTLNCSVHTPLLFSFHQPVSPTVFMVVVGLLVKKSAHTLLFLDCNRKIVHGLLHSADGNIEIVLEPLP